MRVAIAGAGAVGRSIAGELLENGHEVLLIDKAPTAISVERVPQAEWLLADACEITSLDEAALQRCNVVIAATGDDKVNLVVSLLAKTEYGVPRVVARVNNPKNEWLFNESWGVDVAVSTPRLMSALVEEAVSVGDLVRLLRFSHGDANLVELTLPPTRPSRAPRSATSSWPEDTSLVTIIRGTRVLAPTAEDSLRRATSSCSWPRRPARNSWRTCCRCAGEDRRRGPTARARRVPAYAERGARDRRGRGPRRPLQSRAGAGLRRRGPPRPCRLGSFLRARAAPSAASSAFSGGLDLRDDVDRRRRLRQEDPGEVDREQERRDLQRDRHPAELRRVPPPVQREEDRALGEQDQAPGLTGLGVRLLAAGVAGAPGQVLLEDRAEDQARAAGRPPAT